MLEGDSTKAGGKPGDVGITNKAFQNYRTANMPVFGDMDKQSSVNPQASSLNEPMTGKLDINMTIDYEGRPTKVTAKSPTLPINFTANVGKMV